ncbi:MAG TPA: hypothetical protein VEU33_25440 [Archangium sp.]|nr:hypothetical protein [Archangium sp.]
MRPSSCAPLTANSGHFQDRSGRDLTRDAEVLACTSDHGLGWLGRLLTAPLHVGCHVVHPLHPQVSLHHLPRLRDWYRLRYPDLYPRPRRP